MGIYLYIFTLAKLALSGTRKGFKEIFVGLGDLLFPSEPRQETNKTQEETSQSDDRNTEKPREVEHLGP